MVLTEEEKKANKKRDNANQYQKRLAKKQAEEQKRQRQLELGRARAKKSYQNKTMKNSNDNNGPPGTPAGAKTRPIAEGSAGMTMAEQSINNENASFKGLDESDDTKKGIQQLIARLDAIEERAGATSTEQDEQIHQQIQNLSHDFRCLADQLGIDTSNFKTQRT
mmetsp:Transcript_42502/g.102375  ORF Transcript_42502/g.102375 Transcript_42502/m.102375 type:complete len:165 (+) Transcript_42502:190-684(+)|eukprot:CAMPEP_0113467280 /NCGR_PEP_ID=MMETSP0014_2-20120614/14729_1 /TAXON_ID=2857 /ORGANISM="Nitzschia sp." /LENGTH=164 /DNA_ID=CAMNT_0000359575 /DNA_START=168 /DNA_END=662 /DNA_ORIENTATION=+ /assembly_acc=CAM_ASM_000159